MFRTRVRDISRGTEKMFLRRDFGLKKRIERRLECVVFSVFLWYLGI